MHSRFEGWYFKQQSGDGISGAAVSCRDTLAVIPALHTDGAGRRSGSLQLITPDSSWYVPLPPDAVRVERRPLVIRAGDSTFSFRGIELDIREKDLTAAGSLTYGNLLPPKGDIMGPYRLVPFMECRHSVFSMTHTVRGSVAVNGRQLDFSDGTGYMEGDRGRSFPKRYVWAQCNWDDGGPCALMLSAADVRPLGREFVGIIGNIFLRGRELRIATYRGARLVRAGDGELVVRQGRYTLTAQLLEHRNKALRAPVSGDMTRLVKESLCCRARFSLTDESVSVFDFITGQASFEYEF